MIAPQASPARIVGGRLVGASFLDDPRLARVLAALDGDGEEARVVGGAVRNALLGAPVHEVDVTTTAIPDVIIARAKKAGLRAIPTGIEHGTITIICDGEPFEATTLREDVETHGRHATVRFGRDFRADALRRDFTINQLSVDAHGAVHDYAGGLDDIAAQRVRFIGDAQTRVREDYLRILRFFRFHAAYADGAMDADAMHACIALRHGLAGLSRERVQGELMKLLVARRAAESVEVMTHAGIMGEALAGVPNPARLARVKAIEAAHGMAPDAVLRLAGLCVQVEEDARRLRELLRLSNAHECAACGRRARARRMAWARGAAVRTRAARRALPARTRGRARRARSRAGGKPRGSGRRALARGARVRAGCAAAQASGERGGFHGARAQARPGHGRGAEALRRGVDCGGLSRRRERDRAAGGRGGAGVRGVPHAGAKLA